MDSLVFLPVIFASFVECMAQLLIYSKVVNKRLPLKMIILLPVLSIITYFMFNYGIFY